MYYLLLVDTERMLKIYNDVFQSNSCHFNCNKIRLTKLQSRRILGTGYMNPVSRRKSISIHQYKAGLHYMPVRNTCCMLWLFLLHATVYDPPFINIPFPYGRLTGWHRVQVANGKAANDLWR